MAKLMFIVVGYESRVPLWPRYEGALRFRRGKCFALSCLLLPRG